MMQPLTVVDPDLELRGRKGGGRRFCFSCPAGFIPSVIFSFFTQNKGGPRAPPLDPPLTQINLYHLCANVKMRLETTVKIEPSILTVVSGVV